MTNQKKTDTFKKQYLSNCWQYTHSACLDSEDWLNVRCQGRKIVQRFCCEYLVTR